MAAGPDVTEGRTIAVLRRHLAEAQAERDAAHAREAALAEILRVISESPNDVQPVLDVVVHEAFRLCGAQDVVLVMRDGSDIVSAAHEGSIEGRPRGSRSRLGDDTVMGRAILDARTTEISDVGALRPGELEATKRGAANWGFKAMVAAPLLREGNAIGALLLRKMEAGAFAPRQVQLLETFAAQAVIAIENVRLFTEQREALEQQTATADILRVISQSPTDVRPVLDAVAEAAVRFCGAGDAAIHLRDGEF